MQIPTRKAYRRERKAGKRDLWSSGDNAARLVAKYPGKN